MTREEFEQMFTQAREQALRVVWRAVRPQRDIAEGEEDEQMRTAGLDIAEDAVQEAALYFLERLDGYTRVTPALFINIAVKRARNSVRARGVDGNRKRREAAGGDGRAREVPMGTPMDMESILYGWADVGDDALADPDGYSFDK